LLSPWSSFCFWLSSSPFCVAQVQSEVMTISGIMQSLQWYLELCNYYCVSKSITQSFPHGLPMYLVPSYWLCAHEGKSVWVS
jgi:hypothetical protein